jgi:hypothetical protein
MRSLLQGIYGDRFTRHDGLQVFGVSVVKMKMLHRMIVIAIVNQTTI